MSAGSARQRLHQFSGSGPEAFCHENRAVLAMSLQEHHLVHSYSWLLQEVLDNDITSLAVVLKHSFLFPEHEEQVGALAKSMGFTQISLSSEVMPMVKMVPRGYTAAADAYLTPHIMKYVLHHIASCGMYAHPSGQLVLLPSLHLVCMMPRGHTAAADACCVHTHNNVKCTCGTLTSR